MANRFKVSKLTERRKTWKKHLQACKDSGLTQREYCRINNIPQNTKIMNIKIRMVNKSMVDIFVPFG